MIFAVNVLLSMRNLSHLLVQKEEAKGAAAGIQKTLSGKPGSSGQNGGGVGDKASSVKKNLFLAVDIINRCFNVNAPKSVQKLGLFELQPLLNDFRMLYYPYVEVLVQADQEIKNIILGESELKCNQIFLITCSWR